MIRLWKWYQKCMVDHPVKTQVIGSGLIWGLGDISAQSITHYAPKSRPLDHQLDASTRGMYLVGFRNGIIVMFCAVFVLHCGEKARVDGMIERQKFFGDALGEKNIGTSNFLMGLGEGSDTMKLKEEEGGSKINWKRVASTSLFGFSFVGPVGHFWYEGLDRFMKSRLQLRQNSFRFVASKVAVDGFLFGPLDLLVFFTYMGFSAGKSIPQIKEDVKRDFVPAFMLEGAIWPLVQVVNFRFVPVRYQLMYVNIFCLLDSCFLSWIEQQEDAPWKDWLRSFLPSKETKGKAE